jgi:hypothetical protein
MVTLKVNLLMIKRKALGFIKEEMAFIMNVTGIKIKLLVMLRLSILISS